MPEFDLLILGATIVTSEREETADLGVRDGKIAEIGNLGGKVAAEQLDARGLTLIPGVIDTQVHFREPGMEHKEDLESGTRAAIAGGVTTILEMPNTRPTTTSEDTLRDKLKRAEGRAWCDYGFFIGAATDNIDQLQFLENLPGVPGVKIFVGSSTGSLLVQDEEDVRRVMRSGRRRCAFHAENEERNRERRAAAGPHPTVSEHPSIRDSESARLATEMILRLAEETRRPAHILHISTCIEPPMIADAKAKGLDVTAEVTPQHLWFAAPEAYERLGTLAQMNPPIRSHEHRDALWRALDAGVFDVFGSDHAPHTLEEKSAPYPDSPSGMPGVQTMLPVLLTFVSEGRIGMRQLVRMACETPARLYDRAGKGRIAPG
jgi:dihydroorotase